MSLLPPHPGEGPVAPGDPAGYSEDEIDLLCDDRFFRQRERLLARVQRGFARLRDRLQLQLEGGSYLMPAAATVGPSRIGRGEHLDDMPYTYLDLPSYFGQGNFFAFRTLFWWGHEISFILLLGGEHLPEYRQRLLQNLSILEALDVYVSTAETPWDWARGQGHTMRLAAGEQGTLQRLFRSQNFLKCVRYLEFRDDDFRRDRLDEAAVLTFRALEPIILLDTP